MPMPKSVVKFDKNGFKFIDNVDAVQYTLEELTRAALRDCGKLVVRDARTNAPKRTGKGRRQIQYWVKKSSKGELPMLQTGIKRKGFYMMFHELGSKKHKPRKFLRNAAHDNIRNIREIQAKYLSGIDNAPNIEALIDEKIYLGGEQNE